MHYDTFSARLNVNNPTISTCKLDLEMLPSPGFSHFTSHFIYYQTISLQQEDISLEIHVKKKKKSSIGLWNSNSARASVSKTKQHLSPKAYHLTEAWYNKQWEENDRRLKYFIWINQDRCTYYKGLQLLFCYFGWFISLGMSGSKYQKHTSWQLANHRRVKDRTLLQHEN